MVLRREAGEPFPGGRSTSQIATTREWVGEFVAPQEGGGPEPGRPEPPGAGLNNIAQARNTIDDILAMMDAQYE